MKKTATIIVSLVCAVIAGCGYTTRGFNYPYANIYVKPVINNIRIASESRKYSGFNSFPALIEKRLTNTLISKFNVDGNLRVVDQESEAMSLECVVGNYDKSTLRYTDDDNVEEQRLALAVSIKLTDPAGETIKAKDVVGETTYFLSGAGAKSEAVAQTDLIEDTARRIVEAVIEQW